MSQPKQKFFLFVADDETGTMTLDPERHVINRLVTSPNGRAFRVKYNGPDKLPSLHEAVLGDKEQVIARVVMKDLMVDGEKVMEAPVQIDESKDQSA